MKLKESTTGEVTTSKEDGVNEIQIVRPSSLNYKITLAEAVKSFLEKERPVPDGQSVVIEPEAVSNNAKNN